MSDNNDIFKVTPGKYLGVITRLYLMRLWWIFSIPLLFLFLGFANWRWAVVALIVLLLIYPAILTLAVLKTATRPDVVRRTASAKAVFDNENVTLFKIDDDGNASLIEKRQIIEVLPGRDLSRVIIGPALCDFILIPSRLIPEHLFYI